MYMYVTTGTEDFMEQLQKRHANKGLILMKDVNQCLLLHETEGKSIFQTPRRYEVIATAGELKEEGYFVFHNIPVTDESKPVFEHRFSASDTQIESEQGFLAFRLLRPLGSDTYVIMTEWEAASDYDRWTHSQSFQQSIFSADMNEFARDTTHIFSSAAYISTYVAKIDDDE
ncbi:antibiotic biosynthesis monooxygenase family protein [Sporosarcina sp. UB5]|uniref:antibiotic biosynthesis monooxygenase family protein n=1 Tax=Sporosarcina sp. UB5 TaxID=3047463 RepID=UPI003D7935E4